MKLSQNQFDKIRTWMYRNARPLDLARWQYHFESRSVEFVLETLREYQNEDGGFAHALEPDNWNPNSSPVQTWYATEILHEVGIKDKNDPLVKGILRYLDSGHEFQDGRWRATTKETDEFPHAPWWNFNEFEEASWGYNPTISLIGFILYFADVESQLYQLALTIAKKAVAEFLEGNILSDDELSCFIQFYNYYLATNLEFLNKEKFEIKLKEKVQLQISKETDKWLNKYVAKPSRFINSQASLFYEETKELISYEIKLMIETLNENGIWDVPWEWYGNKYPDYWPISKNWWQADIVIKGLRFLDGFELE